MHRPYTIGIWCEAIGNSFNPSEGIARVTALLIKEFRSQGNTILIACPLETQQHILSTCKDLDVVVDHSVSFTTIPLKRCPALYNILLLFPRQSRSLRQLRRSFRDFRREKLRRFWAAIRSQAWLRAGGESFSLLITFVGFLATALRESLLWFLSVFADRLVSIFNNRQHWQRSLAVKANRCCSVDVWWNLNPTWTGSGFLRSPVVTSVWDLVYLEYPDEFNSEMLEAKVKSVLHHSTCTVSMSDYVRDYHVVNHLGFPPSRAYRVHIPPIANSSAKPSDDEAYSLIREFCAAKFGDGPSYNRYLVDFPFDAVDFVFAASNIRRYKNYLRLAKAIAILVRQERRNIKLVTTGDLRSDPQLWSTLVEMGLTVDVLSIGQLPSEILAMFFQCATLSVMPSLFEGGFPLTFSESVSVGTPIAFSSIPTVRERVPDNHPLWKTIFDPQSEQNISETISWCIDHRDEALSIQQQFFRELSNHTWRDASYQYLDIFRVASNSTA